MKQTPWREASAGGGLGENTRPCEEQKKNVVLSKRVPGKQQQQEEVSSDQ